MQCLLLLLGQTTVINSTWRRVTKTIAAVVTLRSTMVILRMQVPSLKPAKEASAGSHANIFSSVKNKEQPFRVHTCQ